MPHGYFIVEQWTERPGPQAQWTPILELDARHSLTRAMAALEQRGQPGLYRVLQMQRCVWAQVEKGTLRLHGSHHSSPQNLAGVVEIFQRGGGRRPVEKARADRARAKAARAGK